MRNRASLLILLLTGSCAAKIDGKESSAELAPALATRLPESDNVDLEKSVIRWKGTKLMKTRYHQGVLRLSGGQLDFDGGLISGGSFAANMNSIEVTDIPEHEPVPRRNLVNHLKSDFNTERFPQSTFNITSVEQVAGLQKICGNLQIKDVIREVCFEASSQTEYWVASLSLNRSDWGIGAEGSWLEKRLVDEEFYLEMEIWTR